LHEDIVRSLQEQDLDPVAVLLKLFQNARVVSEKLALASVNAQSNAVDRLERPLTQLQKSLNENDGKVVDTIVPQVLEHVNRRALPRTRKATDDDDLEPQAHTDPWL
jgi:hypothetical protein